MSKLDEIFAQGIQAWLGEQLKSKNLMNQAGANMIFTHGRDTARKLGLPDEDIAHIMPFPSKQVVAVNEPQDLTKTQEVMEKLIERICNQQQETPKQGSTLKETALKWAVPLALALGLGPAGAVATYYGMRPDDNPPVVEEQQISPGEVGFTVE